ncbi:MAG: hypothetical protein DI551_08900 [Micavibrio aeruginosavorus]|uniref:Uncharacterized protein n=1 Tax=Micavibrio aeruginosavorus TaxID=349221 RepID=A0A2W5N2D8_9BACT|nr:MAG: hypothetical protein DI551_08900 [Micavibrio aeruginosavorus]
MSRETARAKIFAAEAFLEKHKGVKAGFTVVAGIASIGVMGASLANGFNSIKESYREGIANEQKRKDYMASLPKISADTPVVIVRKSTLGQENCRLGETGDIPVEHKGNTYSMTCGL